ncbi:TPM domain-containing protein [Candidatus Gracilibacteria bacterium]|nr:TPM domain-containing protein [Candidatus Gracilibacteria bacterium]
MRRLAAFVLIILLLSACGQAPQLQLADDTGLVERAALENAAAPLLARGATVAIYVVGSGDTSGADFNRRLAAEGLQGDRVVADNVIALYISFEPRYSEFRVGGIWSAALPDATLRTIRQQILNPALRAEDATAALSATLSAFEATITAYPFGARGNQIALVLLALLAIAIVGVLTLSFLADPLATLWARTPFGKAQQRRRRRVSFAATQAALMHDLGEIELYAAALAELPADYSRRHDALAQRVSTIAARDSAAADADEGVSDLRFELRRLHDALIAYKGEIEHGPRWLAEAAGSAQTTVANASAALTSAAQRPPKKRKRPPSTADKQHLADLQLRLFALNERVAAAPPITVSTQRLIIEEYKAIREAAHALWQRTAPGHFRAYTTSTSTAFFTGTDSSASANNTASDSSSSDNSSTSYDNPSSPSSDGGPW